MKKKFIIFSITTVEVLEDSTHTTNVPVLEPLVFANYYNKTLGAWLHRENDFDSREGATAYIIDNASAFHQVDLTILEIFSFK